MNDQASPVDTSLPTQTPVEASPVDTSTHAAVVSVTEAQGIFDSRPDVAAVLTDQGTMHRGGHFS